MNLRLKVSDIWKKYENVPVLKGASFSFDKNGIYALMGQNGSGKSTFLRLCALLEEPDEGEIIYWSGENIFSRDIELRRKITLVLPKIGVFNSSVFNNVAYGLRIRGIKNPEIQKRVNEVMEFVGLNNKKNQNALTLSSGETQRLGIARALVIEPEIFFLDEPTASVDQQNKEIIEDIILKMKTEGKSIIVITSHDVAQAKRLGDWVLSINDGRIISE
jgi:tungstate transport system ATP-binding protein